MRRRRRLIQDGEGESVAEESFAATEAAAPSTTGKRPYGEDVQAALAATVADLPPRGWLALSGWLATGLLLAAGVTAAGEAWAEHSSALATMSRPSLQSWSATILYAAAALSCLLIYHVRRRRIDDFRAHYRIWIVAAGVFLLGSLHASVDLPAAIRSAAAARGVTVSPLAWHFSVVAAFAAWMGLLAWQMAESRASASWLLAGASGRVLAATAPWWVGVLPEAVSPMATVAALASVGDVLILFSLVCFSRFAVMQAAGELPAARRRRPKPRASEPPTASSADEKKPVRKKKPRAVKPPADPPPVATPARRETAAEVDDATSDEPASRRRSRVESAPPPVEPDPPAPESLPLDRDPGDYRGLSKAQRRALRKQKRREQRGDADYDEAA